MECSQITEQEKKGQEKGGKQTLKTERRRSVCWWCLENARKDFESPDGQTLNNMSLFPGPDHSTTTLNADEPVAMTTGQPQRPRGYSSSGVMWQECV